MRVRRLDLDFFGHFTGHGYDFGPRPVGGSDFHIIYGPNEAGKTTTMEGYLRLLYGFKSKNENYGFLHDRKTLKVSGVLDIDGDEVAYTRYANKLVDADGTPVTQAALDRALAGLGQDEYRKLLCLDDETIEQGGKEIIDSKGDIGRLLFAASAGISDLSGVLKQGADEARDLYLKRGQNSRFLILRKELDEITARIKDTDVTAGAYRTLRDTLATATAEEGAADAARRALHDTAARLDAMADVLPRLDTVQGLRARLAAYDHYPARLDIDPETLVTLLGEQREHEAERTRLTAEIAATRATLAAIDRDPDRLSLVDAVEALKDLHGEYRAAERHLPNRRAARDDAVQQMRRHADDLGVAQGTDLPPLALSPAQLAALDDARTRLKEARRDAASLHEQVTDCTVQADDAQGALDHLTAQAPENAEIAPLLDRFDRAGHAAAVQRITDAQARARTALAAISIKGRVFDAPPTASLTAAEAGELVEHLAAHTRDRAEEDKRRDALTADEARAEARIIALSTRAGIVADAAVQGALAERATLWAAHRDTLSGATADRFETALHAVDAMAARRLEQAQDLGELRALEAERADCTIQGAQAEAALARHVAAIAEARAPLDALTAEIGIPLTPTPGGLVAWLNDLEAAQAEARAVEEATRAAAAILAKADTLAADLVRLLPDARPGDTLTDLLTAAQTRAEAARTHTTAIDKAQAELGTLRKARTRCTTALEGAETRREAAEAAWTALVTDLTAGAIAPDTLLASLDPMRGLREANDERLKLADRITKMQAEQTRFEAEITTLATAHGIAAGASPLETFATLTTTATHAQGAENRWAEASKKLDRELTAQETSEQALSRIAQQITHLGAAFDPAIPTDTLDTLREAVGTAHDIIAARAEQDNHEQAIRTRLNVADMAEARAVLQGQTVDSIAATRAALDTDLALAGDRYRTAIETRTTANAGMRAVTGDADVARLVEQRKTLELELQQVALDYLELRLGNDLAEEAIRRYRDAHRSGMLTATETAFADLTNGAYNGLTTHPDGQSETLLAIDAAGATKAAEAMSKGTRFQLFLALRAAAYEQMASTGAVLPFFCDDVFETFDEDRTRAACTLMARIGRTGQAIYLTHHRHVVEIAQDICGKAVTVHTINTAGRS